VIRLRNPLRQMPSCAYVWAQSASATTEAVRSNFGPRYFPAHLATTGYAEDFHRGIDLPFAAGDPVHSVVPGPITRLNQSMFGFENVRQLAFWTQVGSAAVFSQTVNGLNIAGSRVGAETFATATKYVVETGAIDIAAVGDGVSTPYGWETRLNPNSVPALVGGVVGFGFYDPRNTQYVALEYDGTTLTARGIQASGTLSVDGTAATASPPWVRMTYTAISATIAWQYTMDNPITTSTVWTTVASESGIAMTNQGWPAWLPVVYWRSTDTNAAVESADLRFVGWYGANVSSESIGRFGNWPQILAIGGKMIQVHMQSVAVAIGDFVEAGDLLGYAGNTGFDARSGPVVDDHNHAEWSPDTDFYYSDTTSTNPLAVGILPRVNVTNNVAVAVSTANDPNSVPSTLLTLTVTRDDQNWDLNEISLTGTLGTGTINFDTRAGLDPDEDIPVYGGVYYVSPPPVLDEFMATYQLLVYFNLSTFGTIVTAYAKDCTGNVLWSYP